MVDETQTPHFVDVVIYLGIGEGRHLQGPFMSVSKIFWRPLCMGISINGENKMKPTNPNAHTYVNGTDVKTHGYAVTHNTFLQ